MAGFEARLLCFYLPFKFEYTEDVHHGEQCVEGVYGICDSEEII